ncbi:hypothetical protein F7725_023831 [Dissostichus mawsoni]|uniref:Uncharacterized protein n=1 Tax=Dissostichus mawsoni TaxID=36200 RepID=A0A7J5XXS5_DISMA|nr:hypothetical protein F7725_023831 [Dissostichus mawsoni]
MGTRLKILSTFKSLHRTRMAVFKDDDKALTDDENGLICGSYSAGRRCFDPERAFYSKMYLILTSHGKRHERPSDYIFFVNKRLTIIRSVPLHLKDSTQNISSCSRSPELRTF